MRFFAALFFLIALLPQSACAASIIPDLQTSVEIQAVPETPGPYSTVTLFAENVLNKGAHSYTWIVNGTVAVEGIGVDHTNVTMRGVGETTNITLRVYDENGALTSEVSKTITPAELDLVWEGNTFVPPFYAGRPLPTGDSTVTVSAVPDLRVGGARVAKDNLVYEWYINDAQAPYRTGYGLDSITITPPFFDSVFSVSAVAKTRSGTPSVRNSISIAPRAPDIILYEQNPLLGTLFNKAITSAYALASDEVTLRLFPIFAVDPTATTYTWKVNGSNVDPGTVARELTLRKTGSGSGRFTIEAAFATGQELFENAKRNILLTF